MGVKIPEITGFARHIFKGSVETIHDAIPPNRTEKVTVFP